VSRRHARAGALVAVTGLVLLGCGRADDGGAPAATPDAADAADTFLRAAERDGLDVDAGCVQALAARLSAADVRAVVAAGPGGSPEDLSRDGAATVDRLLTCADRGGLADQLVDDLEALGSDVDAQCVRDVIAGLDLDAAFAAVDPGAGNDALFEAVVPCADGAD
jgi:hypothetical protein